MKSILPIIQFQQLAAHGSILLYVYFHLLPLTQAGLF